MKSRELKWIRSTGGPLVCVECDLEKYWHGIDRGDGANAISDYARACNIKSYVGKIEIQNGSALILGDMPVETTAWVSEPGSVFILRVVYIEPDADIPSLLKHAENANFGMPTEELDLAVGSGCLVIFDSSLAGFENAEQRIALNTAPGRYLISTATFYPDSKTSIVVHKLSCVGNARTNTEWSRT